jgi:Fur family transcriptional regulator, peroxide stress response regulator
MYQNNIHLAAGKRLTKSKQSILDYFSNNKVHITTDELYCHLKGKLPNIGLATVYRNLNELSGLGILKQLSYPGMPVYYELLDDRHEHFYCEHCRHIYDVDLPGKTIATNQTLHGHYIKDVNVELKGICKNCMRDYFG